MIKKIAAGIICIIIFACSANSVSASSDSVNIYFFWREGCPHCHEEKQFLEYYKGINPDINVYEYEVPNVENIKILEQAEDVLGVSTTTVPFTIIGKNTVSGYWSDDVTGQQIKSLVEQCIDSGGCPDPVGEMLGITENQSVINDNTNDNIQIPEEITLPIIGKIKTINLSLPVLTIIFGALDGFNPCAMWTLVFLITLLLGMKDRKRMWILGTAFIVSSASVYFIFMAAWLNLILFLGAVLWIRIIIGLVALIGGGYNIREFIINKDDTCKVTKGEKRKKIFDKLKEIVRKQQFILALAGIIALAFAVNLVELICSAGLPAVYTSILALSNLQTWQYYLYLLLYDFVFMLDDLIVFFVSLSALQLVGLTTKYTRLSHIVGGILMVILGLLLIFKPSIIMFG